MPADVTIKAFGPISSLLGAAEVTVPCGGPLAVSSILAQLKDGYPLFAKYLSQSNDVEQIMLVVRNGNIERLDSIIHPGEILILVTPISGG